MASIHMNDISKSFGEVNVLEGINLEIRDGEFLSLLGASGCGKSTLLRIISGLETQSGGSLRIGGRDVTGISPKNRSVSMVFQSYALYPHLTVFQNMAVPLTMRLLSRPQRLPLVGRFIGGTARIKTEIKARVEALAESLDIKHLLDRKPAQLSGGQRQRVALGRAMVREPEVFLMDEPLSNLDTKMRAHMRTELAELHRKLGTTFVYVTHDQEEAMTMSDRVAVMMQGRIMQVDTPRNIYSRPAHLRVAEFIGAPGINILPRTVTSPGVMDVCGVKLSAPSFVRDRGSIGIRPSRLTVTPKADDAWPARVVNVEDLGSSFLVHAVLADDTRTISRLDSRAAIPEVGAAIHLSCRSDSVIHFDADGWNPALHEARQGSRRLETAVRPTREERHALAHAL